MDNWTKRIYQMKPKGPLPALLCASTVTICLMAGGLVLFFVWPLLLQSIMDGNMLLRPDSHTFKLWSEFPEALYIDFYFFNWTNSDDVNRNDSRPKFEEIGPYRFRETKKKVNVTWNDNNGTVTFRHKKEWFETEGMRSVHDAITTINPVALSASYAARNWNYFIRKGLSLSLSSSLPNISITRSVSQFLFEGYSDSLLNLAKSMPLLAGNAIPPWDRFGWFYSRNGSSDFEGVFNMGTGERSVFGQLYEWNYRNQTPYYEGECGAVKGSAGEFFTPKVTKNTILEFFSPDMCRTVQLQYVGENIVNNILGYKFSMGDLMLDNGTLYPGNQCFCNGECVPSGMMNSSSCRYGSPGFVSLPHFCRADPYYGNLVEGLVPDPKKHDFSITLEPTTALPLEVNARLQVNLLLQPIAGVSLFEKVPRVFLPMLWFEQKVKIPENEAFYLKLLLNLPVICSSIGIMLIVGGFVLLFCVVYKLCTTNICGRAKTDRKGRIYTEQSVPLKIQHQNKLLKMPDIS